MKGGDADVRTGGAGQERKIKSRVLRRKPSAVDGTGVLSPQEVAKVVNRRIGAIKGCYERALRRDPSLKGKVVFAYFQKKQCARALFFGSSAFAKASADDRSSAKARSATADKRRFEFLPRTAGTPLTRKLVTQSPHLGAGDHVLHELHEMALFDFDDGV